MRLPLIPRWNWFRSAGRAVYQWLARLFEGEVSNTHLDPAQVRRSRRIPLLVISLLISFAISSIVILRGPRSRSLPRVQVGDIAEQTVYSPITGDVQPKEISARNREDLHKKVAPVFDYDETTIPLWVQNWTQAFTLVRQKFFTQDGTHMGQFQLMDRVGEIVQKETGQTLNSSDLNYLIKNRFSKKLEDIFQELTKPLMGRLIAQTDLFSSYYSTGIIVRQINLGLNETLVNDVSRIWSIDHARQLIGHVLANSPTRQNESAQRIGTMIQYLVIPNLKFNADLTEKRVNVALGRKEISVVPVKRGQPILRIGERVTEGHVELIEALRTLISRPVTLQRVLFCTLMLAVFFQILFHLDLTRKSFIRLSFQNALVFTFITLVTLVGMKLVLPYLQLLFTPLGIRYGSEFFLPISAGAVLLHLLLGRELAHTFSVLLAFSGALLVDRSLQYGIWVFAVTAIAVQSLGACKQRMDLYRSGAWSGMAGAILVITFDLNQALTLQSMDWLGMILRATGSFISGMLGAIIASTIIPAFESIFGYTTNLKLLELSNFNHPLLHNLMMKAPGTYHHSIMVGSLAEIAADRIRANSLLARVSAYYHDIGKMTNPLYFIENQSPQYNPHDHLSPAISARILFSHVKNGSRMGREHNLGDSVNDIIQQHHGTTLTTFFFNKAKETENSDESPVVESDYRYPGPRPQTREAAIVMIADACEASTRSIPDPTPAKIQSMVHSIINKRFLDLQFHDCDLTLKDLNIIEDSISRTLLSLYHHRIEYPGQKQALGEPTVEMPRKVPT